MGDRQSTRDMNRMLDTYLDGLPANRRSVSSYFGGLLAPRKKKAKPAQKEEPEPEPILSEEMPEDSVIIEPGPSFIERMLNSIRTVLTGPPPEPDHIGEMEVVDLPELEDDEPAEDETDELPPEPEKRRSRMCMFLDSLFGRTKEQVMVNEEDEEERVTKLVLYKDRTEKEVRFLLKLIDVLYPRVYKRTRDEFEKSADYQIYQKVRERYIIDED